MKVPEEIRKVSRPKNTIVDCTGKAGKNMYPVRERSTVKYVKGSNPQPHNGKVIGHIIDGKYVPVSKKLKKEAQMLSYGTAALINKVSKDIVSDLLSIYPINIADTIMAIAALKVERPSIKAKRYASAYERSFISQYFTNAALSESSISKMLVKIGMNDDRRREFFQKRISKLSQDTHIIIDGTLKENDSKVNDLSQFSYKSRIKGTKDISIIYAYNLENKEPLCCDVFSGNHLDETAYHNFVKDNNITKGIIIDDKGFPVNKIEGILNECQDLHYLTPIKRTDSRIKNNDMLNFDEVVNGISENVLCKKKQIKGGNFLYAFKNNYTASKERASAIEKAKKTGEFDSESFNEKDSLFGLIVFESNLDLTCKQAYECYKNRWELELLFKAYKSELELKTTNVQGDFSVIASEFINFIATLITQRIMKEFASKNLLKDDTYGDVIDDLNSAWRKVTEDNETPSYTDKNWVHTNIRVLDMIKVLDLCV